MAILWEQRRLVKTTRGFNDAEITRQSSYGNRSSEELANETHAHPEGYASWENVIIRDILREDGYDESDRVQFIKWQRVLNSCIKDGFITQTPNENYNPTLLPEGNNRYAIYSQRRIQISDSKGVELLDMRYFWFKYIPETFDKPSQVLVAVIIAILTTLATLWLTSLLTNKNQIIHVIRFLTARKVTVMAIEIT